MVQLDELLVYKCNRGVEEKVWIFFTRRRGGGLGCDCGFWLSRREEKRGAVLEDRARRVIIGKVRGRW